MKVSGDIVHISIAGCSDEYLSVLLELTILLEIFVATQLFLYHLH